MVLEFTKLEYCKIFFNRTNPTQQCHSGKTNEELEFSETRVLEKVVLCYLFPKQCFFAKNFQKLWYWAILADIGMPLLVQRNNRPKEAMRIVGIEPIA